MSTKESLQKLTDIECIDNLLKQSKISDADVNKLTKRQQILLNEKFTAFYNEAKAEKKDKLLNKVIDILPEAERNNIWEINNMNIMNAIMQYVQQYGGMPPKIRIAEATGLSRQTVDKHFKDIQNNPLYKEIEQQFKFMIPKVLGEVLRAAINGDMKAAKIYFDVVSGPKDKTKINTQNNYLQINGILIEEEKLSRLKPEQLKQIEQILHSVSDAEVIE
ncbi:hypothetical protein EIZ47_08855 [Chryseobacterium lacus]|uniref:Uncharacterized protein n=1 Tax=Chryseobacterium lacus TaxID=2058346 RepID=A0A368MYW0_9FLAO|nr:hypothetical protein [Chryseobacterium lacus]RCU42451.1 hypothetical protein DQ356_08945 [Chryseobacterium lacus]RST27013.1 hypothetical protein EIZ47_08855 [Chryseobacterium lacus]